MDLPAGSLLLPLRGSPAWEQTPFPAAGRGRCLPGRGGQSPPSESMSGGCPTAPGVKGLTRPSRCSRSDLWESRGDVHCCAEEVFLSHLASGATRGAGGVNPGTPLQLLLLTSIHRCPGHVLDECLACPQFILKSTFADART